MSRRTFLRKCRDFPHRWRRDIQGRIRTDHPIYGTCCPLTAIANDRLAVLPGRRLLKGRTRMDPFSMIQPGNAADFIDLPHETAVKVQRAADNIPNEDHKMRRDLLKACRLEAD